MPTKSNNSRKIKVVWSNPAFNRYAVCVLESSAGRRPPFILPRSSLYSILCFANSLPRPLPPSHVAARHSCRSPFLASAADAARLCHRSPPPHAFAVALLRRRSPLPLPQARLYLRSQPHVLPPLAASAAARLWCRTSPPLHITANARL